MSLTMEPPRLVTTRPLLTARNVSKCYGSVQALRDVSATVYPGEVLGIVGESGSGKSTFLRCLNLEEVPDEGSYTLDLPDVADNLFDLDRYARRMLCATKIGIVYQNPHLGLLMNHSSSGNVAERLLVAGERRFSVLRDKARRALDASEFPLDRMDAPPVELSGGMQQRVQLAKAIALCERCADYQTREILEVQLQDTEEDHAYWLKIQLGLMDKLGEQLYLQKMM